MILWDLGKQQFKVGSLKSKGERFGELNAETRRAQAIGKEGLGTEIGGGTWRVLRGWLRCSG